MYQREKAFLIKTAYLAAVLAVGWLILRYALVWLLPFLLALGFAALMEPAITLARRKLRLKRGFLAAVLTLALLALVIALGAVLVGILIFREPVTAPRLLFMALLLIGIIGLKITSAE